MGYFSLGCFLECGKEFGGEGFGLEYGEGCGLCEGCQKYCIVQMVSHDVEMMFFGMLFKSFQDVKVVGLTSCLESMTYPP